MPVEVLEAENKAKDKQKNPGELCEILQQQSYKPSWDSKNPWAVTQPDKKPSPVLKGEQGNRREGKRSAQRK